MIKIRWCQQRPEAETTIQQYVGHPDFDYEIMVGGGLDVLNKMLLERNLVTKEDFQHGVLIITTEMLFECITTIELTEFCLKFMPLEACEWHGN